MAAVRTLVNGAKTRALVPGHVGPGQGVGHECARPQDRPGKAAAGNGLLGGTVPPGDDVVGCGVLGGQRGQLDEPGHAGPPGRGDQAGLVAQPGRAGGQDEDPLDAGQGEAKCSGISQVGRHGLDTPWPGRCPWVAGQRPYVRAAAGEFGDQLTADGAGGAGYQDHDRFLRFRMSVIARAYEETR
jgi:hypothetical protein